MHKYLNIRIYSNIYHRLSYDSLTTYGGTIKIKFSTPPIITVMLLSSEAEVESQTCRPAGPDPVCFVKAMSW